IVLALFLYSFCTLCGLHSFPTRRSSDLVAVLKCTNGSTEITVCLEISSIYFNRSDSSFGNVSVIRHVNHIHLVVILYTFNQLVTHVCSPSVSYIIDNICSYFMWLH